MALSISQSILSDVWVQATWDDFVAASNAPEYEAGRFYFDQDQMRIEMAPLGAGHGRQNSVVLRVIGLFAALRMIRIAEFINCSFYKAGERGCQPDIAFYMGADFQLPPQNNEPVSVEEFGPPTLVVEIGSSTLSDDLGAKRLLYERLGVSEYWVVDVTSQQVIAFSVANEWSGQIQTSEVLPGLDIALVEEALERSQSEDDGSITRWLMEKFA
ncbi:MAG: Uma2 family endonuclease [Elainellaceae cyanobacterium]